MSLPQLDPSQLKALEKALKGSNLSKQGQTLILQSLNAASNPQAETTEFGIASLDDIRQMIVLEGIDYLDSSFAEAEKVVSTLYMPILQDIDPKVLGKDPKTLLQEYLQKHKLALPAYSIISTMGKAHKTQFKVECIVPKFNIRTIGEGTSRRSAEQEAAKHAYEQVCADN